MNFYSNYSIEEQLTYKESLIYITYNLLKLADNKNHFQVAFDNNVLALEHYGRHKSKIKELPVSTEEFLTAEIKSSRICDEIKERLNNEFKNSSDVKRLPLAGDKKQLLNGLNAEPTIDLSRRQLNTIIDLTNRSLENLANGDLLRRIELKRDFKKTAEIIK